MSTLIQMLREISINLVNLATLELDGVRKMLCEKGMTIQRIEKWVKYRGKWRIQMDGECLL